MKVIVDTNVLVSAVIKDRIPEEVILFIIQNPEFEWVASPEIVAEYIDVLKRPRFGLPEHIIQKWQAVFTKVITIIEPVMKVEFSRDPKDAPFLGCALEVNAEYLISGDKDFKEAYKVVDTTVISVAQFKTLIGDKW